MLAEPLLHPDDLQRWRACPRRFWLHRHAAPEAAAGSAGPMGPDAGPAPDVALRASFPGAIVVAPPRTASEWSAAIDLTRRCLAEPRRFDEGWAIFGACLLSDDGVRVRIDVLAHGARGLRLFKLRHATVGNESDVDTAALWAHVAARCGLRLQSVGLLLVDTDFTYPGFDCYAGLFREVDLGPSLGSRAIPTWLVSMRACERGGQPAISADAPCLNRGNCEHAAQCPAPGRHDPAAAGPARLEIVGRELAAELRHEGHADLHSVHEQRLIEPRHRRALRAIQSDAPVLDTAVAAWLRTRPRPRYFLRVETIGFAVPVWPGTQPYQALPIQWTCDVDSDSRALEQFDFIATPDGDPRRAFAQSLLEALGTHGPVFAYNAGFERNRIRELSTLYPELAPGLDAVLARMVDLFQIARDHYYHPRMSGSWSFRSVCLPLLDAQAHHEATRFSAQETFTRLLQRGTSMPAAREAVGALRQHGRRHTEALRRLVQLFEAAPTDAETSTTGT